MYIRQPIVATLGHVDHGKTTLLDCIRGSAIAKKEAGGITQHIGATEIPLDTIKKISEDFIKKLNLKLTIPGLLIIDTPGHEAFTNLRKRGGSIADIAILVVDINEGFKNQTREALAILKQFKVPFIVAANKIDMIKGWSPQKTNSFLESYSKQSDFVKSTLDEMLYKIVISLADFGINSERFDKIEDYTKQVAIVPTSGKTGEGIAELLMLLTGLSQKYLENNLKNELTDSCKGSIIEVKEEKGLGKTLDIILYNGKLKQGDTIVVAGINGPIVTKVKAILKPAPLKELREKGQFISVHEIYAAAGAKIAAPNLDEAIAGMQFESAEKKEKIEEIKKRLQEEIKEIIISTENEGIILKSDSVGALEALIELLKGTNTPIRKANISDVNKTDVVEAKQMKEKNPTLSVILAFNVKIPKDVESFALENGVTILSADIIYKLVENYQRWKYQIIEDLRKKELESITTPSKFRILPGYIFRQNNPAIFGVDILAGKIKTGQTFIKVNNENVGKIKEIQKDKNAISEAVEGDSVAVAMPDINIGRNVREGDILYSEMNEEDYRKIRDGLKKYLSTKEIETMKEILEIKRKQNPLWGL